MDRMQARTRTTRWLSAAAIAAGLAVIAGGCVPEAEVPGSTTTTTSTTPTSTTTSTTSTTTTTTAPPVEEPAPLDITWGTPSFPVGTATGTRFATNISCGPDVRNVFDVALPPQAADPLAGPIPFVVYLHGGGFTGGDKSSFWSFSSSSDQVAVLQSGVALVSMNYRLLQSVDPDGVIKPMTDVARCLQFVRYHAENSFDIDPAQLVLLGGSAGAGTALWLNTHDDLADPDSDDPIARESTRPLAVAIRETQATYDLVRWTDDVFADYAAAFGGATVVQLAAQLGQQQRLLSFFGITNAADIDTPPIVAYRQNVDMLGLMDIGDGPIWVANTNLAIVTPTNTDLLFHHAYHAREIERRAQAVGVDVVAAYGPGATPSVSFRSLVLGQLGVA